MKSNKYLKQNASGKEKIGHRRVNKVTGEVTYKKTASSSISGAIQLGIAHSVGQLSKVLFCSFLWYFLYYSHRSQCEIF